MKATAVKERPILVADWESRAVADASKTQIRVPLHRQPEGYPPCYSLKTIGGNALFASSGKRRGSGLGQFDSPILTIYGARNFAKHGGRAYSNWKKHKRIKCPWNIGDVIDLGHHSVRISNIKVTCVQDLWAGDVLAEGLPVKDLVAQHKKMSDRGCESHRKAQPLHDFILAYFRRAWDEKHGPGSWESNPWVWALTFKRCEAQP